MAKNINGKIFSEETRLKLDIFRKCFREWLPVFVQKPFWKKLYVYDFFAGSGYDIEETPGSPIIFQSELKGRDGENCEKIRTDKKKVFLVFNEKIQSKFIKLKENTDKYFERCKEKHQCLECVYKKYVTNFDFGKEFKSNKTRWRN